MQILGAEMIVAAHADSRPLNWRVGFYAVATAAAALLIAGLVFDASGMAITDRPSIQRATSW
jgi:hypothetical protein